MKKTLSEKIMIWFLERDLLIVSILIGAGGVAALVEILRLPSQKEKALVAGFSGERLILIALTLSLIVCFVLIATFVVRESARRRNLKRRILAHRFAAPVSFLLAGWGLACGWIGYFYPPSWLDLRIPAYLERLQSILVWFSSACLLLWVLVVAWDWQAQHQEKRAVLSQAVWRIFYFPLVLGLVIAAGVFPEGVGMALRRDYLPVILPVMMLVAIVFHDRGRLAQLSVFATSLLLFFLPLIGLWASGISEPEILFGLFPNNDAAGYFYGAERVMNGSTLHAYSATRPLFSAYMAGLLSLWGGNLQTMVGSLVFLAALSSTVAAREAQRRLGLAGGVLVWTLLFLFYRRFNGGTMTENLGLTMGAASFALIWRGVSSGKRWVILAGFFSLSIAWNARAGAIFILPAMVLWLVWDAVAIKHRGWKHGLLLLLAGGGAIAAGFLMNTIIFKTLAIADAQPLSNFSFTLYGIARGGEGWGQYQFDHPEVLTLPVHARAQAVYELALEHIRKEPHLLIKGMLHGLGNYFTTSWMGAYGFVGPRVEEASLISRLLLFVFGGLGLLGGIFRMRDWRYSLTLFAIAGIILSVPFVPPVDADTRAYAATTPWMGVLPVLGWIQLKAFCGCQKDFEEEPIGAPLTLTLNGLLIFLVLVAPLLVKTLNRQIRWKEVSCASPLETVYVRISPGSAISVVEDGERSRSFVPTLRMAEFTRSIHDFHKSLLLDEFAWMTPPKTLIATYNLADEKPLLLILDSRDLIPGAQILGVCGHFSTKPYTGNYFYGEYSKNATP